MIELQNNYEKYRQEEREENIEANFYLIQEFIEFCNRKQIDISKNNFDYIQSIGIVANYPNLVHLINPKIKKDKEDLVRVKILENEYAVEKFMAGYYCNENYIVMVHPYFRRRYKKQNNFEPHFIDIFFGYDKDKVEKHIAIDSDRVRINVNKNFYMELDTWYGAKFTKNVAGIEDGIVKLRAPAEMELKDIEAYFNSIYSLDIKWTTQQGIKAFQLEEFREVNEKINFNEKDYYPVKYLHAEYDIEKECFRHLDGAIHFYTEQEYFKRRESDINYNKKNSDHIKTASQKLFKLNGTIKTEEWVKLVSHYLSGNYLICEYFEGKQCDYVIDILEKIKIRKEKKVQNNILKIKS